MKAIIISVIMLTGNLFAYTITKFNPLPVNFQSLCLSECQKSQCKAEVVTLATAFMTYNQGSRIHKMGMGNLIAKDTERNIVFIEETCPKLLSKYYHAK